ncbi:adenylyltransferase/cytidyltransferase family protein [Patescibacteria group bacterium]|nr:adenylyltransferase/cytidyltransferase family protein [Patescibacteria group bacterium]
MKKATKAVKNSTYKPTEPNLLMKRATRIITGSGDFEDRFVSDHKELKELLENFRHMGCAIAFTTGVWDLLHIGHAKYIERGHMEAKRICSDFERVVMVVGVDTDKLTSERKGPKRPIVPEDERYRVLAYLRAVDIVTPQYKANTLFKIVLPNVLIISTSTKDLPPDVEVLKKYCGDLVNLEPQAETSTSARIRRLSIDGATELGGKVQQTIEAYFEGGG